MKTLTSYPRFSKQELVEISISCGFLCAKAGLPFTIVEKEHFWTFMKNVQPAFQTPSYRTNKKNISEESQKVEPLMRKELSIMRCRPNITLDCWTSQNHTTFPGCTKHYVGPQIDLRSVCMFLTELTPPHTAENIWEKFEDEKMTLNFNPLCIKTDAANMKTALKIRFLPEGDANSIVNDEDVFIVQNCMPSLDPNFWIGCAAHTLQLVIHDGMHDVSNYPSLNKAHGKCHKFSQLAAKSSHFKYGLPSAVPKAKVTQWNSEPGFLNHVLHNFEKINKAPNDCGSSSFVLKSVELALIKDLVCYLDLFKEGTDTLQAEKTPTITKFIPTIQQLENALQHFRKNFPAVNCIKHHFTTSLKKIGLNF